MQPTPFILTLFGITGDLSQHKLIPALYELFCKGDLPDDFTLIGYGRRDFTVDAFRDFITTALPNSKPDDALSAFLGHWHYVHGAFDSQPDFANLATKINELDPSTTKNHFFYLAVAPEFYVPLTTFLHDAQLLTKDKPHTAVLVEKPYGTDEATATALTHHLDSIITEKQIFRVDHFLGKASVRELNKITDTSAIDHIQITAAEATGIGNRGAYYDAVGVIRDMIQNHCLMILAILLSGRDNRLEALQSLTVTETVTGQYTGYLLEAHVAEQSTTETFAAVQLASTLPDWRDKAIYIRTGKILPAKQTYALALAADGQPVATFPIQPVEQSADTRSDYASIFFDALTLNHTYFISDAEIIAAWHVIDPVIAALVSKKPAPYAGNSWGPVAADNLMSQSNRVWINSL